MTTHTRITYTDEQARQHDAGALAHSTEGRIYAADRDWAIIETTTHEATRYLHDLCEQDDQILAYVEYAGPAR